MYIELTPYRNKRICVALSGGKDSIALMHYLLANAKQYGISVLAVNFDHCMRGEESQRDSAFVQGYCKDNGVKCISYKWQGEKLESELSARRWRYACYEEIIKNGLADCVATAHHMNDNAETVLFNLARGASLSGVTGITDSTSRRIIRPMIAVTRAEIEEYIIQNDLSFVEDSTNFTDDYTRNKIRHNVLPQLEKAVPGAVENIFRFSRLAAEDEEYFDRQVAKVLQKRGEGFIIKSCTEPVIFKRALKKVITYFGKTDYTSAQMRTVYEIQWLNCGKKFCFLGLIALREQGGVAICLQSDYYHECDQVPFFEYISKQKRYFGNQLAYVSCQNNEKLDWLEGGIATQSLLFDIDKIPPTAVIRFKNDGDKFTKFGGGTKSLGDYLTNKKVPQALRASLPLVCNGSEVLIVGGVEIADSVKITEETKRTCALVCANPFKI